MLYRDIGNERSWKGVNIYIWERECEGGVSTGCSFRSQLYFSCFWTIEGDKSVCLLIIFSHYFFTIIYFYIWTHMTICSLTVETACTKRRLFLGRIWIYASVYQNPLHLLYLQIYYLLKLTIIIKINRYNLKTQVLS